jgi:hypothetical protein
MTIGCFDSCAGVDGGRAAGKVAELVDTGPHIIPAPAVNDPLVASCSSNAENGAVSGRRAASDLCLRRTNQYLRSPSIIATAPPTTPAITRVLLCFTLEEYFNTWAEL